MKSFGKVDCQVTVQLGGGGIQPVDRTELATRVRRIGQPNAGRQRGHAATSIAGIADTIESASGDTATVQVKLSAEDADTIRLAVFSLAEKARNPVRGLPRAEILSDRAAAYGLDMFYKGWVAGTGFDASKQIADQDGRPVLGSGFRK